MRKKILLSMVLLNMCIPFSVFGKNISVEDVFLRIENDRNSYITKLHKNKQENIENLIKDNKLGDFNGLNLSSNFNAAENYLGDRVRKYDKTLQNRLSYGPFYINYNYVENKNNYISYGLEKNLKDIFYSPYSNQLKINRLNRDLNNLEHIKNIENKKIDFLNLYQSLLDTQNELTYRREAKKYYEIEVNRVRNLFNSGMGAKINFEAAEVELEEINLKIEILEKKLNALYEIVKNDYNLDLQGYTLKDLNYMEKDIEKNISKYMDLDLQEIKLNIKILNEKVSYDKYNSFMPDVVLGFERIDKTERYGRTYKGENIFSIKFSKKLFSTDTEYKNSKIEEKKLIDSLEEKKRIIGNEKTNLLLEYEDLRKTAEISQKKSEILKKRYEIKRKENELERASYLDVIDAYNKYLTQEIESKKATNSLNSFMYKVAIKSEYEVESEKNYQ